MTAAFTDAYAGTRARLGRKTRTPAAALLGRFAARTAHAAAAARRALLTLGGFGLIDYAAWEVAHPLGYLAGGVSLLVLDWLTSE
jgi:ABC-type nitrate/sulfonate/bicarbonate transport system substrate-binding protein